LTDTLKQTSESLIKDFEAILEDRKALLDELAIYIKGKLISRKEVNLIFICTHNSRRSHMAQIWARRLLQFTTTSRTSRLFPEAHKKLHLTSMAVNALKKAGFKIKALSEKSNPKYRVKCQKTPVR
jgi:arsenate reductase